MFFELIFYYGGRAKILEVGKLRSMDTSLLRELLDVFSGTERLLYIYIYPIFFRRSDFPKCYPGFQELKIMVHVFSYT